jgi:hypothetical protein
MPTPEQFRRVRYLSDVVLYAEAITFIRRLVDEQDCSTLPASQVMGLLNIAKASSSTELNGFIKHQRERNWPMSKSSIKIFYTELEKVFMLMRKRIKDEFGLVEYDSANKAANQEIEELMVLLARDFIQHLVAENGLLAVEKAKERARRR